MRLCSVEGCPLKHKGLGYCVTHYRRFKKSGDPLKVQKVGPKTLKFEDFLEIGGLSADGFTKHLFFTGKTDKKGYGRIGQAASYVHRLAWEKWVGSIPKGNVLDHRPECPKNCVNPAHLQPLTISQHATITHERIRLGLEGRQKTCRQ